VNVVDFDEKYIVSASGDRTIKVWNTSSCEFLRTLNGHKRGIACLQYRDRLVAVRIIQFGKRRVAYSVVSLDSIRLVPVNVYLKDTRSWYAAFVWDLVAALDPRALASALCIA